MILPYHVAHFLLAILTTTLSVLLYRLSPVLLIPMFTIGLSIGHEYGESKNIHSFWDWSRMLADICGALAVCVYYALSTVF